MSPAFLKWVRETCGERGDEWVQANMAALKERFEVYRQRQSARPVRDRYEEL